MNVEERRTNDVEVLDNDVDVENVDDEGVQVDEVS